MWVEWGEFRAIRRERIWDVVVDWGGGRKDEEDRIAPGRMKSAPGRMKRVDGPADGPHAAFL